MIAEKEGRERKLSMSTDEAKSLGTRHEVHFPVSEKLFTAHHSIKHSKARCRFEILIGIHQAP